MKRGGKRREGMGWDLACPSSGEEGCPVMSGCRERQTVVSTVVRCCLRGVKWVLPPWAVDYLVGSHGASNIAGGDGASS